MATDEIHLRHVLFLPAARLPRKEAWQPKADVHRVPDGWLVKLELAGVRPEDVRLSVRGNTLLVQGTRRDESLREGLNCYLMEIAYSRFERVLEQARKQLEPGVATGLAWTEAGGDVLYVEATLLPGGRGLRLTGQLGDVMRESARAAQSYVWSHAPQLGIDPDVFRHAGVHIHVPAGAVPKDGPSAGVTMVAALTSLYTRLAVRSDTAMTGEITLAGLVLPVGGIKEKVLAARRAGIRRVILPRANEKDLGELPDSVRREMEFVPAARIEDVLKAGIPDLACRLAEVTVA
jgi:ATP-dependent Lon protease